MQSFNAEIKKENRLTFIEIPFNAKEVFCIHKGTIYVTGTMDGKAYRGKLLSRGNGRYIFILDKVLQKSLGFCGETITIHITMFVEEENKQKEVSRNIVTLLSNMDVVTTIKSRQSIRKFTSQPISETMLNTILMAGLYAPTAKNKRPYHFIVLKSNKTLAELAKENSNAKMLEFAKCAIVVCGDKNLEGTKEFLYADCAAATQNILLCAHGLGLGAVWCGVSVNSNWRKLIIDKLNIPMKLEPISVIALGYPNEVKELLELWEPEKIHYDKW